MPRDRLDVRYRDRHFVEREGEERGECRREGDAPAGAGGPRVIR
jgi:hypothetical protein